MFCISKEWLVFTFLHIQVVSVFQQSNLNAKHYCKEEKMQFNTFSISI